MLNKNIIDQVSCLARIHLKDEELERLSGQLEHILSFIDTLKQVDVKDIMPTSHAVDIHSRFRDDNPQPSLPAEKALLNAPSKSNNFFLVPKILD